MYNTELERQIHDNAVHNFSKHVVEERCRSGLYRSWCCGQPKTHFYRFHITTIPGRLIVVGDIGELIVERVPDMLYWCRQSIKDSQYFASTVPSSIPTREFSADVLKLWIQERLKELDDQDGRPDEEDVPSLGRSSRATQRSALTEAAIEANNNGPDYFYRICSDAGMWDGGDPPDWTDWNSNFIWTREAIRWFLIQHNEPEIT